MWRCSWPAGSSTAWSTREGKLPHVVRGTARKREYVADVTDTDNPDGSTTTKTTISQRIELVVRTVDLTGTIHTFLETDAKDE